MKKIKKLMFISILLLTGCTTASEECDVELTCEGENLSALQAFYEESLINDINIEITEEDLNDLQANPTEEEFYNVTVSINDEVIDNVGFRTKGNSSLDSIARSESNRYSCKVKLNKYDDTQLSEAGADEFVLNNMFADPSYMREYISYQILADSGVVVPYTSYANLTINGESQGLYLLVESIDTAFLEEHFNSSEGILYKADEQSTLLDDGSISNLELKIGNDENAVALQELIALLNTDEVTSEELKSLIDFESFASYLVFNTVFASYDSYNGDKSHNYYLYKIDGKFYVIPWDYNMAFNGYPAKDSEVLVTEVDIKSPVYGTTIEERPLIETLLDNEDFYNVYIEKINQYNQYLGDIEIYIKKINDKISTYVETDPLSLYSYEDYISAITYDDEYEFEIVENEQGMGERAPTNTGEKPLSNQQESISANSEEPAPTQINGQMQQSKEGSNQEDNQMATSPLLNYAKERYENIVNQLSKINS